MGLLKKVSYVPMVRNLSLFFVSIIVIFFAVIAGQFPEPDNPYVPALSSKYYYDTGRTVAKMVSDSLGEGILKSVLKTELPVLAIADEDITNPQYAGPPVLKTALNLLAGVKLEDPLTYLKAEIPMLDVTPVTADSFDETGYDEIDLKPSQNTPATQTQNQSAIDNKIKSEKPLIGLYNTHTSETFELTDGLTHLKGKAGGVTLVAGEIKKVIEEKYGIAVTYSPVIHDLAFNRSYSESEKTVKQLLKDNPELRMLLDIHRDGSLTREQSLTKVNGQSVAKILIVVGTDARADHPKWRKNLELAKKIAAKMDVMYPGLSRGITIKDGRYNQQYSPNALLMEVGSAKNTTEEAIAAGRLLADVVVAVLNDMDAGKAKN